MTTEIKENAGASTPRREFPSTQWSMVLHASADSPTLAHDALEFLCQRYWYPLYTFIRREGRSHHEAEDCTQEFLLKLLTANVVGRARPERGRFRTFLLSALRNFMVNKWQHDQAIKRGGGLILLPLEFNTAEARFANEPTDPDLTPEQVYDRNWALSMINRAVDALRDDYVKSNRGALFDALAPVVWESADEKIQLKITEGLGLTKQAAAVALHRLRRRLGERLRLDVAQTVADSADVDAELRYLVAALGEKKR